MCQWGVSAEKFHPTVEFEKFNNFDMREIMRGMPDLWSLSNIPCRYNDRALTYDEDSLPGISGLLNLSVGASQEVSSLAFLKCSSRQHSAGGRSGSMLASDDGSLPIALTWADYIRVIFRLGHGLGGKAL